MRFANLKKELELLAGILILLLLDAAVNHTVQGHQESLVNLSCSLISLVCLLVLALEALLVTHFRQVGRVLWLQNDGHVEQL